MIPCGGASWLISLYYPFFPSDRVRFFDCQHMSELKQNRKFFEWYHGMLKQQTWSEIKDSAAQQRSPTGPARGTLNSMLLDFPSFAVTAGCVCLASPPWCPAMPFFLPVFKGAAINSLARREMSHSHIAEVGEWEGLQDKELWRLKRNRGETRCNY